MSQESFSRQVFYLFVALPALCLLLKNMLAGDQFYLHSDAEKAFVLLLLFWFYCFSSVFWGPLDLLGKADLLGRSYYLVFFTLAIYYLSKNFRFLSLIPYVFVILTVISLGYALVEGGQVDNRLRGVGRIEISTHAAGFYCIASVLAAYFSCCSKNPRASVVWGGLSLFLLIGTVLTVSRATMFINAAFLILMASIRFRNDRWKLIGVLCVIGVMISLILGFFFPEKLQVLQQKGLESARYKIWTSGIDVLFQSPVFGQGLGINEAILVDFGPYQRAYHAHNLFLDYAVHLGLVGLLGLMALLFIAIWRGIANPENRPWLIMLGVYLLFSLFSGRIVVDRIQPDWVTFYLPWIVLLASPGTRNRVEAIRV